MATRPLPSDPQLLLRLIDEIDSDNGRDGYIEKELQTGWHKRHEDYEEFEVVGQERISIDSDGMEDDEVNVEKREQLVRYLAPEDGPIAYHSGHDSPLQRSWSVDDAKLGTTKFLLPIMSTSLPHMQGPLLSGTVLHLSLAQLSN